MKKLKELFKWLLKDSEVLKGSRYRYRIAIDGGTAV